MGYQVGIGGILIAHYYFNFAFCLNAVTKMGCVPSRTRVKRVEPTSTASATRPDGISLAGLRAFVSAHGGAEALTGKTTSDVKWELVVPETKAAHSSYVAQLRASGGTAATHVGAATAFISHVYTYQFLDVVAAIELWESRQPTGNVFYYFDLLVVNQHGQNAAVAPDVLWCEFTGGVRAVGHTLLVLTLGASAGKSPLTRAWCVAEIAAGLGSTAERSNGFEVIMSATEEAKFQRELTDNFDQLEFRLCSVSLKQCHAWHGDECLLNGVCIDVASGKAAACSNDLSFILGHVQGEIAFEEADRRVIDKMRSWMAQAAYSRLACISDDDERAGSTLQFRLAHLLLKFGRPEEAEALIRGNADVQSRRFGPSSKEALDSYDLMAEVLRSQNKLEEAEEVAIKVLTGCRLLLGSDHPETLIAMSNLAGVMQQRGKLAEAESLLREALAGKRKVKGNDDASITGSMAWLAKLLQAQKNFSGAELLFREVLAIRRRTLGYSHPDSIVSLTHLGSMLFEKGELEDAAPLLRESLSEHRRIVGNAHPNTRGTAKWLVAVLHAQGDSAGAAAVHAEFVTGAM
jgi:hypothetical protein